MLFNKKGFMLAEVIIVSTIILSSLTLLYTGLSKAYIGFERLSTYHSIDAIYASRDMFNNILDNGSLDGLLTEESEIIDKNYSGYDIVKSTYKVNKMIFISKSQLDNCSDEFVEKRYVNYLKSKDSIIKPNKTLNDINLIVTEIKDGDNYYYGYYEVG